MDETYEDYPFREIDTPDGLDRANELKILLRKRLEFLGWHEDGFCEATGIESSGLLEFIENDGELDALNLINILEALGLRIVYDNELGMKSGILFKLKTATNEQDIKIKKAQLKRYHSTKTKYTEIPFESTLKYMAHTDDPDYEKGMIAKRLKVTKQNRLNQKNQEI